MAEDSAGTGSGVAVGPAVAATGVTVGAVALVAGDVPAPGVVVLVARLPPQEARTMQAVARARA
jgi:hypothetical protein